MSEAERGLVEIVESSLTVVTNGVVGQLEDEIREGAWYVVDSEPRDPFSDAPHRLWREVLRRQRGELALVSTYPEDPALN